MSRPSTTTLVAASLALALSAASAACNDPYALPPATRAPEVFDLQLWALTGTPLEYPSAFDLTSVTAIRTDRSSLLDFAFDITVDSLNDTTPVLLPRGAIGLYRDGGLQITTIPFDSITKAPNSGYDQGDPLPVRLGSVILAASRSQTCNFGYIRPIYGKMQVTALDFVQRSITLHTLVDRNCGYSSLRNDSVPPTY